MDDIRQKLPYLDESLSYKERVDDLLSRLTLDEKINMLSTHHHSIERLGIKEWFIGTECARGYVTHDNDRPSTVFPQPIGMASMFDDELMEKIGEIAGNEFRAYYNRDGKGGLMIWGPTVDMERDPRWGRTEEAYGEDPFLTGKMTAAYTRGLRGDDPKVVKTIPTLKHFCANNNEKNRGSCSANIDPRTKHEYYYAAFKPAVTKGGAYSMMAAYNELSGVPAICNPELQTIVKDKWGLGFVVSDGGDFSQNVTYHRFCSSHAESLALCLKAGCDVMTDCDELVSEAAYKALKEGLITEADIERAVGNSLEGRFRLGEFDSSTPFDNIPPEIINCESSKKVNLRAAMEGITLLKNSGILPLSKEKINKLLICGPLADENLRDWYTGYSDYEYSVLDGFRRSLGEDKILYDNGFDRIAIKSVSNGKYLTIDENGFAVCSADSVGKREIFEYRDLDFDVLNIYSCAERKYLTFTNEVKAETEAVFQWFTTETIHRRDYEGFVTFESRTHDEVITDENGRLICRPRSGITKNKLFEIEIISKGSDRIAKLAAQADASIVCVGNHPMQVARECYDRPDITLPKPQQELTEASYSANPNTVMLIVSSYPFSVNRENELLPAIVYTSHAGPELGNAVSACLLGEYNPAGRTPMTWYSSVRELPDIMDYDIIKNDMTYRYYRGKPLYPFGYGLSYSSFAYSDFTVYEAPDKNYLTAELDVKNISDIDGDEVVQIYFRFENKRIKRPIKQLCGFRRQSIKAGSTANIIIEIDRSELEFWDVSREKFCLETGDYTFMAGASSEDIRDTAALFIEGETVPPRDVRKAVKAINFDDKGTVKMLWSKGLSEHFIQSSGYTPYLIYQSCNTDGAKMLEIKASAWEKPENVKVYADTTDSAPIAEIAVPPTDGIDDFRTITVSVEKLSSVHDLIFELGGSSALLSFRLF
ncbi:MAG: glycoside hydrolase family 3 C-terminal domain-containing protein [Oscillospiraceae bacterium]|nr:glycoside hydrolase family 3 C-terminal domain-containing protein [Oscillospiraceae bacterium]